MRDLDSCNKHAVTRVKVVPGNRDSVIDMMNSRFQHQEKEVYEALSQTENLSIDTLKLHQEIRQQKKFIKGITLLGFAILIIEAILFKTGIL